ncbi:hypothetical protein ABPG75_004937 [Micractinium tetrahymenae]
MQRLTHALQGFAAALGSGSSLPPPDPLKAALEAVLHEWRTGKWRDGSPDERAALARALAPLGLAIRQLDSRIQQDMLRSGPAAANSQLLAALQVLPCLFRVCAELAEDGEFVPEVLEAAALILGSGWTALGPPPPRLRAGRTAEQERASGQVRSIAAYLQGQEWLAEVGRW